MDYPRYPTIFRGYISGNRRNQFGCDIIQCGPWILDMVTWDGLHKHSERFLQY